MNQRLNSDRNGKFEESPERPGNSFCNAECHRELQQDPDTTTVQLSAAGLEGCASKGDSELRDRSQSTESESEHLQVI